MNIEKALATRGWMADVELVYLAHLASKGKSILEIGSWMGRSARAMADNTEGQIHCVDTWADDAYGDAPAEMTCHKDWLWNEFNKNHADTIAANKVIPYRIPSAEAPLALFGKRLDVIFIDAGHNYEDVKTDILAWRPFLAEGGVLCGHDLYPKGPFHPGVLQAVNELIGNYSVIGTIWTAR
jgi:predicted O-methyltransferase YrrM